MRIDADIKLLYLQVREHLGRIHESMVSSSFFDGVVTLDGPSKAQHQ